MTVRAAFRQADLTRAFRAAQAAGIQDIRVEIDPASGRMAIITGKAAAVGQKGNGFDEAL